MKQVAHSVYNPYHMDASVMKSFQCNQLARHYHNESIQSEIDTNTCQMEICDSLRQLNQLLQAFLRAQIPDMNKKERFLLKLQSMTSELDHMVKHVSYGETTILNTIDGWLSGMSVEDKLRACQYIYNNIPKKGLRDRGRDYIAMYCDKHGIIIKKDDG